MPSSPTTGRWPWSHGQAEGLTTRACLKGAEERLREAGISTPWLDAQLLLSHALGVTRVSLMRESELVLDEDQVGRFQVLMERRLRGEPVAYIRGVKEFWTLELEVGPGALIPRPETETVVEAALEMASSQPGGDGLILVELGTGCGAIAISLSTELKGASIVATESSPEAMDLARRNAARHGVWDRVRFVLGNLLDPFRGERFDMVISNPPYVPTGELSLLDPGIREYEPLAALDGGPDGLAFHRAILNDSPGLLKRVGHVILEMGEGQDEAVADLILCSRAFDPPRIVPDLAGRPRVIVARRR